MPLLRLFLLPVGGSLEADVRHFLELSDSPDLQGESPSILLLEVGLLSRDDRFCVTGDMAAKAPPSWRGTEVARRIFVFSSSRKDFALRSTRDPEFMMGLLPPRGTEIKNTEQFNIHVH